MARDVLCPPVKGRGGTDQLRVALQVGAAGELPIFELIDAGWMLAP